jgi:putative oxidoreductase
MKIEQLLNDPVLSVLGLALVGLWAWTRSRSNARPENKVGTALETLLRVACGALFLFASFDKILDPAQFSKMMVTCYNFLPAALVPLASVVIPWLECFTGISLILGFRWRGAALIFCGLMVLYTCAIVWDLAHGVDCSCGCFKMDSAEKMTGWTVLRDSVFFILGYIVMTSTRTLAALDDRLTSDAS